VSDDAAGVTRHDVPYPVEWEADVVLRDGSTTHLRPIRPDDADALQRFHMAQSERSVYYRFFAALNRIPERMLRQFVTVDHVDRVALVAVRPDTTAGEEILGVARFDVVPDPGPRTAEVAFNIADSVQGRGLGSVLLEHVADAARERGIHRFVAEVLPQNRAMLAVFREAGYAIEQHLDDGFVHVGIDLDPTDRSREVMADREHRAEAVSMASLLGARRVLLVGPGPGPRHSLEALQAARVIESHRTDPGDTELTVLGVEDEATATQAPSSAIGYATSWDDVDDVDLLLVAAPPGRAIDAVPRAAAPGARGGVVH
jgi:RimJ/RimL family protein N-acetyltransferase